MEKHHIFLVEDDLSFGSVLKSYLEINDYTVTWVDDGKLALDKFRNGKYHICILDVMLPNIDGLPLAARSVLSIRKSPWFFSPPKH
jgi:DNA-binding response OmpR family regulator